MILVHHQFVVKKLFFHKASRKYKEVKLYFCMQYIESLCKMVNIKSKVFTAIRYEVIHNIEWRIRRKKTN